MTTQPDAGWWSSVQFTVGAGGGSAGGSGGGSGGGFTMSREEMTELLRMAQDMDRMIGRQFAGLPEMVQIPPPAGDPGSAYYLGTLDEAHAGIRAAGERYGGQLSAQSDYLRLLMTKLNEALLTVEAVDADRAADIGHVMREA